MKFEIKHKDEFTKARTGTIITDRETIDTPFFMPVGTAGTVKSVHMHELSQDIKTKIILCNTYHLYLRPGTSIIEQAGGLHKFVGWNNLILTDSGGYQVFSLSAIRKITNEGVMFQSHIDGSRHLFTPAKVVDIQRSFGSDFMMAFDECTPYPCEWNYAKKSLQLTHDWLKKGIERYHETEALYGFNQTFMPIVQGSTFKDLRKESAEFVADCRCNANAIGGLSVGEPENEMYEMISVVNDILPEEKPRYLMGVGTPTNILEAISLGVDMFDCVLPTRNGRNGMLFTAEGTINIKNKKWENDFSPIDDAAYTFVDTQYSKAYLRHLVKYNEILALQIASIHNLGFYVWLVKEARKRIIDGSFANWKKQMIAKLNQRL